MRPGIPAVILALLMAAAGQAAAQCGGTQLCGPGVGDCSVAADCTLTLPAGGLSIDLGARRLVITKILRVNGPPGASLTIRAGDLLIDGGTVILPGDGSMAGNLTVLSATNATIRNALIDVTAGSSAGLVDIEALGGNLSFSGRISANGNVTRSGFGGDVTLFASGNTSVGGTRVDVTGGDLGGAGSISVEGATGSVVVSAPLKASGGDGGDIEVSAGTTLQTLSAAVLNVDANGDAGGGGSIDLSATGDLSVAGEIIGTGSATDFREEGRTGGDGADLDVFSGEGAVSLGGKIDVSAAPGGFGGSVDVFAGTNVTLTKALLSQSDGIDGLGGDVFIIAGGAATLAQQLDVRGRLGTGGSIDVDASGNLTVSGSLNADGSTQGGTINLSGCAVNIQGAGSLTAQGPGGMPSASNTIAASSTMTVAGTLRATNQNLLLYRQAPAPSVTGPNTPPAIRTLLSALPCCVSCPPPTTSTTTTTSSTTSTNIGSTTTTTSITSTTIASICGNGVVTGAEQCDDGNTVGGDCCSATCRFEAVDSACASDGNPCTRDVCNGGGACTHPAGNAGTVCRAAAGACDQAETCTGTATTCPADTKRTSVCRAAAGPCDVAENCDGSSNACPADGFAPATTSCRAAAGACDRAETCTGNGAACPADQFAAAGTTCRAAAGVCDVAEACTGAGPACPTDRFADDGTSCAGGGCNLSGSCQNGVCTGGSAAGCGPCETCDPQGAGCVPAPRTTCIRSAVPAKARFRLKDSLGGPRNDLVQWRWVNGGATTLADFGDPVGTDDLTLCVFDSTRLLFRANVPAGGTCGTRPCWTGNGKTFRYKNKAGTPDGVLSLSLNPGPDGKSKILLKARGTSLAQRAFGLPTPPLPVPVAVQLQSASGQCWEATYQRSGLKRNDGETFDGFAE